MSAGYYCNKCMKFVLTMMYMFAHPHLDMKSCLVCRGCGEMVYLKKQEESHAL